MGLVVVESDSLRFRLVSRKILCMELPFSSDFLLLILVLQVSCGTNG